MTIRAVAFDAFGTLIGYGGRRINPYLRLEDAAPGEKAARLPFLTRNVPVDVFADELGRTHLLPVIQRELAEEVAGLRLFDEVDVTLRKLRAAGTRIAVSSGVGARSRREL
jgi:phosphoglycolate phosphatase-like HAD superfamily hydrolase